MPAAPRRPRRPVPGDGTIRPPTAGAVARADTGAAPAPARGRVDAWARLALVAGLAVLAVACSQGADQRAAGTTTTVAGTAPPELAVGSNVTVPVTLAVPDGFVAPDTRGVVIPPVLGKRKDIDHSKPVLPMGGGTARIRGTVIGPDGPVEGATVRLERFVGEDFGARDVSTNKDGIYDVGDLPGGRFRVRAWQKPTLATTEPPALFLAADHGDAVIDLVTEKHEGTNLQGAFDVAEPHVGDRVVFRALLTEQQVDDNGIVQGVGIPAADVQLTVLDGLRLFGDDVTTTYQDGFALFTLMCLTPGEHSVIIGSSGLAVPVGLPPCLDGTVPPDDPPPTEPGAPEAPTTTTTTRPRLAPPPLTPTTKKAAP
jgi:hypothetical protein